MLSTYSFWHERADYATHVGQVESVDLQDGSRALLNSGTALDVAFGGPERRVHLLAGEAWFKVRHMEGRLFVVDAGGLEVVAKGTAFSVNRDSRGTSVKVTEGVVVVRQGSSPLVELEAGRSAEFRPGERPKPVPFVEADALAWRERKIVLDGVTLGDALAQIDRYRSGRILFWARRRRQRVSAILTLERLDEGLDALAASQGRSILHVTPWLAIVH